MAWLLPPAAAPTGTWTRQGQGRIGHTAGGINWEINLIRVSLSYPNCPLRYLSIFSISFSSANMTFRAKVALPILGDAGLFGGFNQIIIAASQGSEAPLAIDED
jgi:hypothetical protein